MDNELYFCYVCKAVHFASAAHSSQATEVTGTEQAGQAARGQARHRTLSIYLEYNEHPSSKFSVL